MPPKYHLLQRLHAAVFDPVSAIGDRLFLASHRRDIVDGVEGRVLDLGAGTGWSFRYLEDHAESIELHALEPDPFMRARAKRRAASLDLDVTIHAGVGEALPFDADRFDVVLSSLVLCTVDDPEATRAEIARVLKPDGELRMFEHIHGTGLRGRLQSLLAPGWRLAAGGCELRRRQHEPYLGDPRFAVESIEHHDIGLFPIKPFVAARFRRRASEDAK